jgi:FtsH-binding integral membrane protein
MDNNQPPRIFDEALEVESGSISKNFVANVFSWMALGLLITAAVSWYGATSGLYLQLMQAGGIVPWVLMLSPFAFIIAMNAGLEKFSATTITLLFIAFSAVMGLSLSSVFLVYGLGSVANVFAITAGTFTLMAIAGYTTSVDLSRFGSILFMGLIGIILASIANYFIGSSGLEYIVSILGVLIFTGLVAYDTQRIKRIAAGIEYSGTNNATKLSILAATSLYLNFINLFLFLLRFFGGRD